MTTEELVLQINRNHRVRAEKIDGRIFVYNDTSHLLFTFDEKATNFLDFTFNDQLPSDSMAQPSREYVAAQIEEYLQTPIKERFPEKKYHLVVNPDALKVYGNETLKYVSGLSLGNDHLTFWFGAPATYSEGELEDLKQICPRLAPAINEMKEPVEGD